MTSSPQDDINLVGADGRIIFTIRKGDLLRHPTGLYLVLGTDSEQLVSLFKMKTQEIVKVNSRGAWQISQLSIMSRLDEDENM